MVGTSYAKKIIKWILSLLLIIIVGITSITVYSAYYSFGTMIFGVHTESAIKDFWSTEFLLGAVYIIVVITIAVVTGVTRLYKKHLK